MPALRKPHRVAFLLPQVTITGSDVGLAHEAALVLWAACIEACQRHPGLAVYDAESTPLFPQDAHFTPQHAVIGATPTDGFYATTRRDELVWLEVPLPKHQDAKLHALRRDGVRDVFTATGPNLGEQINNLFTAWLAARGLPPLERRHPAHEAADLIAIVKPIAPILVEQARAWALPTAPTWSLVIDGGADDTPAEEVEDANAPDASLDIELHAVDDEPAKQVARSSLGRPVANKLPQNPLKLAALRVLHLALREDLDDLILAIDPEQPQALFAKFRDGAPDFALLRRVIAAAPCWAKPYAELDREASSELELVAGAGIAALCRPQHLDVIERVAALLEDSGLVDEGIRLLDRAQIAMHEQSRAHLALLGLYPLTGRVGAWLAQASRSARVHGCPMDIHLPWYPDQIQVDLSVADALMNVGRLDEAIALRANRLEGRESTWPRHTRILTRWRKDPRYVAWCYALEGYFRGDPARTIEGFGRIQPGDDVDVAALLDALVATGREDEVSLAWAEFGLGHDHAGPVARLAAARALLSAGEWRRGLEEMWRVELGEPGRDEHVAIARCGQLLSCAPIDVAEAALGERVATGATSIARRMARDIADFMPGAAKSSVVTRALGKVTAIEIDPASTAGFSPDTRSKKAIDKFFDGITVKRDPEKAVDDARLLEQSDQIVSRWLEITYAEASDDDARALAQAATYMAAQALARYLAATTLPASPITGALRTVAAEALALVRTHRDSVTDRDARALLRMIEPLLRRVDRWIGSAWLGTVERSLGIDERAAGDVAGFAREQATIAARVLGPEESAVLAASIARLHREQPKNWAAAVVAQATQLALHTGYLGAEEWADAIVAQLAAKEIELDDAIDELHTTCYLTQGLSAKPAFHAARVLLGAGRGPAAVAVLVAGLPAADAAWRDEQYKTLEDAWKKLSIDIPFDFAKVAAQMFEALQKGDAARAEKLGRWAVAFDPTNAEAHRNLGLALAQQGKIADALVHLVHATPDQATQILSGVLYQAGKLPDAMAVLDYASRWYVRADQWLTYGGIAYAAMDNPRTVHAYALAYKLDPDAFDATQLNAYAGVLDEVGDYDTCELIAKHLIRVAGDDIMWLTNGWNHLACAKIGQGKFDEAEKLASDAVAKNPLPDNGPPFAATLERAKKKQKTTPPQATPPGKQRDPVYALMDASDLAAAANSPDKAKSWRVKRVAIESVRFRFSSENAVSVTPRARAAAASLLAEQLQHRDRDVVIARCTAMQIREQASFARDPIPMLGDRMTREAFYQEFRARGGVVIGEDAPPPPPFKDRVVVPGSPIARASDYIALLRDLAAIDPREAIKQFDLDDASYLEVARAWTAAMEADPTVAQTIAAGLAKR